MSIKTIPESSVLSTSGEIDNFAKYYTVNMYVILRYSSYLDAQPKLINLEKRCLSTECKSFFNILYVLLFHHFRAP